MTVKINADTSDGAKEDYEKLCGPEPLIDVFVRNLSTKQLIEKIFIHQGYSKDFTNEFRNIDFLFIDGDHSINGCTFDFNTYFPFVSKGGVVALHDYYPDRPELGPTYVVEEIIGKSDEISPLQIEESLWIGKKI